MHRNSCNTRPSGAGQAADQYDHPKADADWQKPTLFCLSRTAALSQTFPLADYLLRAGQRPLAEGHSLARWRLLPHGR